MESFIFNTGLFILFSIVITLFKTLKPEESYEQKTSLILGISAILFFAIVFLITIVIGKWTPIWAIIYFIIFCLYIYLGSKDVALKTITGVFSRVTNKLIGNMTAGLGWADPIFEKTTTNINGVENESIDLQELEIEIHETSLMHTSKRGIQAKVKNVVFMLEVIENRIPELFEIEGGKETIKNRILSYINFFFLDEIGKILPTDLDEDKGNTLKKLSKKLRKSVNKFCVTEHYPFEIPHHSEVTIGDTELEAEYYKVLAKEEYAKLENKAKDIDAEKLRERIANFGKHNLPNGTEKEQNDHALIALGIVKKDMQENKYAIDSDFAQLAKEIALYFKK